MERIAKLAAIHDYAAKVERQGRFVENSKAANYSAQRPFNRPLKYLKSKSAGFQAQSII